MKKLLYFSVIIAFASACKIGQNYKGHDVLLPKNYAQTDSVTAATTPPADTVNTDTLNRPEVNDLLWWAMFNDPTLDTLIREAMYNNRDALIAAENILQARYALKIQNAEMLPQFDVALSAKRGSFVLNNIEDEPGNLFLGYGAVNWEIDVWGKYRRLSEAKKAEMMATEFGYRGLMLTLISDVASNYFSLLQARAELDVAKQNVELRDSMLYVIKARFERGYAPKIDLNQAQIQKNIAEGAVPLYERKVIQTEHLISVLLGRNPGRIASEKNLQDQNFDVNLPAKTPLQLLERRPDVLASEFYIKAQNAYVGAAQGNRLPGINLFGLFGVGSNEVGTLSFANPLWNLGGQLVGPLFYWGQLKRQVDIEKSKRLQSYYRFENTVFNALREVEDALVEIETTKREIEIGTERQVAALEAQYLSKERYSKGVTSYLEFLESQRQAFDAELNLAQKQGQLLIGYMRLYKALGGGWLTEAEKKAAEEAEKEEKAKE
jgi:multidrug efflux system outer membrane protein